MGRFTEQLWGGSHERGHWFATMKRELAHRRRWATRAEARRDLIRWIEAWFNSRRLHSSNNYNSPIDWENLHYRRGDGIAA